MSKSVFRFGALTLMVTAFILARSAAAAPPAEKDADPDAKYDRMDGRGESGKRVDVVEWEGNLEIHVYPAGSLSGLALKLEKTKDKAVMVIGYRFNNAPQKQLIRRAILGVPFAEGFKVYRDKSVDEYDKIIISNNALSGDVVAFKLDAEPKQLYPDGHPANGVAATEAQARKPAQNKAAAETITDDDLKGNHLKEKGAVKSFEW
ncbi:MAG: hypothetical protein AB7P04_12940 [Bacteriovoracia bacterium]